MAWQHCGSCCHVHARFPHGQTLVAYAAAITTPAPASSAATGQLDVQE